MKLIEKAKHGDWIMVIKHELLDHARHASNILARASSEQRIVPLRLFHKTVRLITHSNAKAAVHDVQKGQFEDKLFMFYFVSMTADAVLLQPLG